MAGMHLDNLGTTLSALYTEEKYRGPLENLIVPHNVLKEVRSLLTSTYYYSALGYHSQNPVILR